MSSNYLRTILLMALITLPAPALAMEDWNSSLQTGEAAFKDNDYAPARKNFRIALERAKASRDRYGLTLALLRLAHTALIQKDYKDAEFYSKRFLALYSDTPGRACGLYYMACAVYLSERKAELLSLFNEALACSKRDLSLLKGIKKGYITLLTINGDYSAAEKIIQENTKLSLNKSTKDSDAAQDAHLLTEMYISQAQFTKAEPYILYSIKYHRKQREPKQLAQSLRDYAFVLSVTGRNPKNLPANN